MEYQVEKYFDYNHSITKNKNKINVFKIRSDDFYEKYKENEKYNFIYIDGNHGIDAIHIDMKNCLGMLKEDGIMYLDDYLGGDVKT